MIETKKPKYQIIVFSADDLSCYTLNKCTITGTPSIDTDCRYNDYPKHFYGVVEASITGELGKDKVKLSPKQMKQIKKYNAERDVELLIREKQVLEDEIKLLQEKKSTEEQKFKQLSKFANEFLKSNEQNIDDYIQENYVDNNYDDYYD